MTKELGIIYHNEYGNMETEFTDVEFIEIKTYNKRDGFHTHAIYYGPTLYREIDTETMTNPSAYIDALKKQGWKRLKAKKIFIGKKEKNKTIQKKSKKENGFKNILKRIFKYD